MQLRGLGPCSHAWGFACTRTCHFPGNGDEVQPEGSDAAPSSSSCAAAGFKVDDFGFYQLEADETQGGGDDVSSCGGTDAVAVESSVGSEVQFVSEQQCSEAGEAGKAAVEAGVEAGVKAGVKAGVAGVKAGVEAAAGSGNGKPPSVTSSPPPFMKKGQQKARALLNRALRKNQQQQKNQQQLSQLHLQTLPRAASRRMTRAPPQRCLAPAAQPMTAHRESGLAVSAVRVAMVLPRPPARKWQPTATRRLDASTSAVSVRAQGLRRDSVILLATTARRKPRSRLLVIGAAPETMCDFAAIRRRFEK